VRKLIFLCIFVASCSQADTDDRIRQLQTSDLYEKGSQCHGSFFRIDHSNFYFIDGKNVRTLAISAKFIADNNGVILSEKRGQFQMNTHIIFNTPDNSVRISDITLLPEPSSAQWTILKNETGMGLKEFRIYHDRLQSAPTLELCAR